MQKQKIDEKRGITDGSGVALETDSIHDWSKNAKMKKEELLKVTCPFYGYLKRNVREEKRKDTSIMM